MYIFIKRSTKPDRKDIISEVKSDILNIGSGCPYHSNNFAG